VERRGGRKVSAKRSNLAATTKRKEECIAGRKEVRRERGGGTYNVKTGKKGGNVKSRDFKTVTTEGCRNYNTKPANGWVEETSESCTLTAEVPPGKMDRE